MAPMQRISFKRGDVVVYKNVDNGDNARNGSLGICTGELDDQRDPIVRWLLPNGPQVRAPYSWNLEKIGHIDEVNDGAV